MFRFVGEVDGRVLHETMSRIWQEVPDITSHDSICDMRAFTGNISFDDIKAISEAWRLFCGGSDRNRRTAVVSHDRFAPLLVRAIEFCFATRELAVLTELQDAEAWLERR